MKSFFFQKNKTKEYNMNPEVRGLIVKREDGSEIVNYDNPTFPSYIYDGWVAPHVTWEGFPIFMRMWK